MLTGKATSIDTAHASGQLTITSIHVAELVVNMANDITPDISRDIKNEKV